ncbi:MAG TPA: FAD-dependent oxidoreductase [Gaiellaceae bacterium]|nr:FAD-dependent oxidoreductase [Gaiellaceae bacterium]
MTQTQNIVVLGGGFAGLEAAFLARERLGERARITLVSDRDEFLFKPNTIYIPFGADPASLLIPLAKPAAKQGIGFVKGVVEGVDPARGTAHVSGGVLPWDYLVIATGAGMAPEEVPGLSEHAETIWTPAEMASLGERLRALVEDAKRGARRRILFLVPPNNKCAGPLYEMVFMTETWLRRQGVRDRFELVYTTYEPTFIAAFGPKLHEVVVSEFAARGIEGHTDWRVSAVEAEAVAYENGERVAYDLLVAFPPYVAALRYDGLPADERGFLETELGSRRVRGHERIFAPGDAGDFPVKQAFLAFLQADAVVGHIAADVQGRDPELVFTPVSMCVMEQFDKATFAQVPLALTGDPLQPVAVRADADGAYRVGVSPLWRLGKKVLGLYLNFRFRAGRPFHAGAPWKAMEVGLKGMSTILARR